MFCVDYPLKFRKMIIKLFKKLESTAKRGACVGRGTVIFPLNGNLASNRFQKEKPCWKMKRQQEEITPGYGKYTWEIPCLSVLLVHFPKGCHGFRY